MNTQVNNRVLFWHRRDLRIEDNAGLYKALTESKEVFPVFVFDSTILTRLKPDDQRIHFIFQQILALRLAYQQFGSDLYIVCGDPKICIPDICEQFSVHAVYTNRDYEPYARERDQQIQASLVEKDIKFIGSKDHVIFEKGEVLKDDGQPYAVFTPYSRKWKSKLNDFFVRSYPVQKYISKLGKVRHDFTTPTLESLGFQAEPSVQFPPHIVHEKVLAVYHEQRDIPAIDGTSKLGLHLRFGTISIRALTRQAIQENETFLNELIWREFYQMILYHYPDTVDKAFKPAYDLIKWEHNETHFKAWCEGKTGYPLVDAGMRELNTTGHMHNRVRMVVASFLTKHLLIDWRLGERYFAEKLLDFELASNIGGWQWAAGCGCDAAPYFRVFNPTAQQEKFDKSFNYIKKWVPEFGTSDYPKPIIDHKYARERVLSRYKEALT